MDNKPYQQEMDKARVDALVHLGFALRRLFGSAATNNLREADLEELTEVLTDHAKAIELAVSSHYTSQMVRDAQQNSWNVLRGVLAGEAIADRRHGVEPDSTILAIINDPVPKSIEIK